VPVADGAGVGSLGLLGELALGRAHRLVGGPDAGRALVARSAGRELEPAQFLARQRRLGEGVVLFAAEQAPEQARELARGGDDGDLVAAAGADTCRRSPPTPPDRRAPGFAPNSSNAAGVVDIRPEKATSPSPATATSQKSR